MISRSHRSQAAAHASAGMTWLLNSAAAIDARRDRTGPRWNDMAACFHHRCDMVIRINRRKRVVFTHKCIYLQHEYG